MAKAPRRIGSIVNQLLARRGYAQVQAAGDVQSVLEAALGPALASSCRAGNVRRGLLDVYASDSVAAQELSFQKRALVKQLQKQMPQAGITDVRIRVG